LLRRLRRVGSAGAYGFSTLWRALGPPDEGTIVTIDPDRERTDLARGWWRHAGIADERITVVSAKALDAFESAEPALAGPFELAFIDAIKQEYTAYLDALIDGRLTPGALSLADNVLWSGRVAGSRPDDGDERTTALRAFCEADGRCAGKSPKFVISDASHMSATAACPPIYPPKLIRWRPCPPKLMRRRKLQRRRAIRNRMPSASASTSTHPFSAIASTPAMLL